MKQLVSIIAFVMCLVTSSISIADESCKAHEYETVCKEDSSCEWDDKKSKCKNKKVYTGCSSHSEFYCEANGCRWNSMKRSCETKGE
jgi:hypothetical protein